MKCPRCGSVNIQVVSKSKGFGLGNGIVGCIGYLIWWPLILCSLCGIGKSSIVKVCANCGHQFK